jgi:hypothetical protein
MNENMIGIKKRVEKSCRLLSEVGEISDGDKFKLVKIAYELETARDAVQSAITRLENESVNSEFLGKFDAAEGSAELIENGWCHLRLEATLPNGKNIAEVKRISDTVTKLLDTFSNRWGYLPEYDRAFVAIIEHTDPENAATYDHDNKGYRVIPNALKGRMFDDDNQFIMSLGLFTVENPNDPHCDIYVIPAEDIAEFSAQYLKF